MSTSIVIQVGKLEGEWDFEAKKEQVLVDIYDVSKNKITVG